MEELHNGKFYKVQYQDSNCHIVVRPALFRVGIFLNFGASEMEVSHCFRLLTSTYGLWLNFKSAHSNMILSP